MKPMLAKKLPSKHLTFPCIVQPKLNGVRALWIGGKLQSRDEHLWLPHVLPHITSTLRLSASGIDLDGELYLHGLSLQQINSRVAVNRNEPHRDVLAIEYHVFDIISDEPQEVRAERLRELSREWKQTSVFAVETLYCASQEFSDMCYKMWRQKHYEGLMYRKLGVPYGQLDVCGNQENRWHWLLKRKEFSDLVAEVVDCIEGNGQFANSLGAFLLRTSSGVLFSAGSGLTVQERVAYWANRNDMPGTKVRVEYEMLSDGGVPLKPTIACVEDPDYGNHL